MFADWKAREIVCRSFGHEPAEERDSRLPEPRLHLSFELQQRLLRWRIEMIDDRYDQSGRKVRSELVDLVCHLELCSGARTMQQKDIIAVDHRRIRGVAVRLPNRTAVEGSQTGET